MVLPSVVDFWESNGELFEYPPELCMKNTFIDARAPRSPSLQDFFTERRVRSCPSSQLGSQIKDTEKQLTRSSEDAAPLSHAMTESTACSDGTLVESTMDGSLDSRTPSWGEMEMEETCDAVGGLEKVRMRWSDIEDAEGEVREAFQGSLLSLGLLLPVPAEQIQTRNAVSSSSGEAWPLTNIGSQGHGVRFCKPCAFFHTKGCESGDDCQFCHACAPDAKKVMKKQKSEIRKMRSQGGQVAQVFTPMAIGRIIPRGIFGVF
jgi:hypothetical protein